MDERTNFFGTAGESVAADGAALRGLRPAVFGALSALVLAVGGLLLLGGGSAATDAALSPPPAAPAAVPGPAASASPLATVPAADASPPPTVPAPDVEVRPARDPFQSPARAAVAAAPAAPAALAGAQPDVSSPTVPAPPAPGVVPTPARPASAVGTLALVAVEGVGERRSAIFTVDGARVRTEVGSSFGPDGRLLLLALQQEQDGVGWTAVVRTVGSAPFDVVTGKHVHLS